METEISEFEYVNLDSHSDEKTPKSAETESEEEMEHNEMLFEPIIDIKVNDDSEVDKLE
jgi:hypothetical protein